MKNQKNAGDHRIKKRKQKKPGSGMPFFMRIKYSGRGWIQLGALLLLALSGYELYIRLDDFRRWTDGVRYMSEAKGESFFENMSIILQADSMTELRNIIIFLFCCVLFSLMCLIFCNKPKAGYALIPADIGIFILGMTLKGVMVFGFGVLLQWVKLIPLLLIPAGCVINLVQGRIAGQYMKLHGGKENLRKPSSVPPAAEAPAVKENALPVPPAAEAPAVKENALPVPPAAEAPAVKENALPVPPSAVPVPQSPYTAGPASAQPRERLFK